MIGDTDPFTMGSILLGLARQDQNIMQLAEQMGITPQSLVTPHGEISLGEDPASAAPFVPAGAAPVPAPAAGPLEDPMHMATVQQQPRRPQVRMPEQQRPVFSGGVTGAQKAPDLDYKPGLTPAQALMQALLGAQQQPRQQARRGGGSLGDLLGG